MTRWHFTFPHQLFYQNDSAIIVPIALYSDVTLKAPIDAKLDTGSTFCVFQRYFADLLELELESGWPERISTATGSFLAYGHEVTLSTCGLEWQTVVYFAESEAFYLNVVGRIGFLDRLKVALVDYEQTLYLSAYGEE